ncbi:MAG TPA: NAD(P)-dependent alcohol dehydrogenase [Sulfolobales archaeon]|nr:NAD(P)-dependent alcohol dehydrogenase [Sulfolobales archaeon]
MVIPVRAAVLKKPRDRFYIEDIEAPKPSGHEILVRVKAAGMCHTDVHLWEGHYGPIRVEERGVRYPLIMGHEIAGEVVEIGDQVRGLRKGDRVVVYPWIGDGVCKKCLIGDENLCVRGTSPLGVLRPGGYAEYVLVPHERYAMKVGDAPLEKIAPASCAGITAYNAVKKAGLEPGDYVMILGVGGLGHLAIQIARKVFGASIIAVDIREEALRLAEKLGAEHMINPSKTKVDEEAMRITEGIGVDAAIDFVGITATFNDALRSLKRGGKLVIVGLMGEYATFTLPLLPLRSIEIRGAYVGGLRDLYDVARLVEKQMINIETSTYPLEEINDLFDRFRKGLIVGRAIIKP